MPGRPDAIIIIDTNIDHIAVKEAHKLGIPVIAIVDSNSNIDHIDFPIPGNDDSGRAINLYCNLFSSSVLKGLADYLRKKDVDNTTDMEFIQEAQIAQDIQATEKTEEQNPESIVEEENKLDNSTDSSADDNK